MNTLFSEQPPAARGSDRIDRAGRRAVVGAARWARETTKCGNKAKLIERNPGQCSDLSDLRRFRFTGKRNRHRRCRAWSWVARRRSVSGPGETPDPRSRDGGTRPFRAAGIDPRTRVARRKLLLSG